MRGISVLDEAGQGNYYYFGNYIIVSLAGGSPEISAFSEDNMRIFNCRSNKRILLLLRDIDRNGNTGIGKPERLSGDLAPYWSRRIDDGNRLVYRIENNTIKIVQCRSHYWDS